MDRRIRYHPLFDCDVREAAAWYDRRSQGLGGAFVQSVRVCVDQVIVDPDPIFHLSPWSEKRGPLQFWGEQIKVVAAKTKKQPCPMLEILPVGGESKPND